MFYCASADYDWVRVFCCWKNAAWYRTISCDTRETRGSMEGQSDLVVLLPLLRIVALLLLLPRLVLLQATPKKPPSKKKRLCHGNESEQVQRLNPFWYPPKYQPSQTMTATVTIPLCAE
jgi:hypothetical protein